MIVSKKEIIVKSLGILIEILLISILETTIFPYFKLFGAVPKGLPVFTVLIALAEGPAAGILTGLISGLITDGLNGTTYCFYTVLYLFCGALASMIRIDSVKNKFFLSVGISALTVFITEFLRFFFFSYLFGITNLSAVITVILPETLYSLIVLPLVFLPIFFGKLIFKKK